MTGSAAVEVAPDAETRPLRREPNAAADPTDARTIDATVEVALPDGTQVRVANGATAALLADVFAAPDRR
jgi:hypothetical protein